MSHLDRRAFLRGLAVAAAGSAAPASLAGGSITPGLDGPSPRADEWQKAACPLCPVACGLLVRIQGGRATAAKGDPASPVSGGLACARGYYAVQALYGRDRLVRPLIRRDGIPGRASLPEALDLVAERLREVIATHGPSSVAWCGSAESSVSSAYLAAKLFKGAIGTNNIDTDARLRAASGRAGLISSFGRDGVPGCFEDVDHADVFILWDENLAETAPVLFSRMLARRRTNPGVRIIDLTTRTTRTSYAADRSFLHAPQSHLALANAICREIVVRGGTNRDFLDRHVGFRKGKTDLGWGLGEEVMVDDDPRVASWDEYTGFLADYSPERVQPITKLSPADLRYVASLYADRSLHVLSVWGAGVNRQVRGTWANNALHNIHLLVGKVAEPGNGTLCVTEGASDAGADVSTLPRGLIASASDRREAATRWNLPIDRIPRTRGRSLVDMFRALERGEIRFLWIQSADPLVSLPNLNRYRRAASPGDRFLVVSDAYPTPTTDLADVVLPSAWWLEREAIRENAGRRLQYHPPLVSPPGAATDEGWQLVEVARRLGYRDQFPWSQGEHAAAAWEEYRGFRETSATRLPTIEALKTIGTLWPLVEGQETRWRYNTRFDPAADPARGAFDFHGHEDHRAWIWLRPHEPGPEVADRGYPFTLVTGEILEHAGTGVLTRRIPTLHRAVPRAYVELNAEDARALGIRTDDLVRLVSRRGALELPARIDYRSQPPRGQVFVPVFDEGHPVNLLTLDATCPLSGEPAYTCAVRVERAAPRSGG